jgi:hypothetical protein
MLHIRIHLPNPHLYPESLASCHSESFAACHSERSEESRPFTSVRVTNNLQPAGCLLGVVGYDYVSPGPLYGGEHFQD